MNYSHEEFMQEAIKEAEKAFALGEVPVGAVVVRGGEIIGRGHNLREAHRDPTAHAEIIAIRQASRTLNNWRLTGCSLYVTVEPCPMCAGAIVLSRISTVVYGIDDPKAGAVRTLYRMLEDERLNHRVEEVISGVMAEKCRELMQEFFTRLRK